MHTFINIKYKKTNTNQVHTNAALVPRICISHTCYNLYPHACGVLSRQVCTNPNLKVNPYMYGTCLKSCNSVVESQK